jgi:hypothetical protein
LNVETLGGLSRLQFISKKKTKKFVKIFLQKKRRKLKKCGDVTFTPINACLWPRDTQNDIQHNDIQRNVIQLNAIQHSDTQHNAIQHDVMQNLLHSA